MGYTHYWRRKSTLDSRKFIRVAEEFKRLLPALERAGVTLAGPLGDGKPVITGDLIAFNGPANCGHSADFDLVIPWPTSDAGGVLAGGIPGTWFAGHMVDTRLCPGDCSYESFVLERIYAPMEWERPDEDGFWFAFCKTAFRPYDLAVTAALLVAKRHLGDAILVSSDGEDAHWFDAKLLCQMELGYGLEFTINSDGELISAVKRGVG